MKIIKEKEIKKASKKAFKILKLLDITNRKEDFITGIPNT